MPKSPNDRLARALRENLKRRKAGASKDGSGTADDGSERFATDEAGKMPAVPVDGVRPNTAEKKS